MSSALEIVKRHYPGVKRVKDAKASLEVVITAQDCKGGKSGKPSGCAMARAFKRTHDGAIISRGTAYLIDGTQATRYIVPEYVRDEIVSFDRNHDFRPGTYHLQAPWPTVRLMARHPKPRGEGPQIKRRSPHKIEGVRSIFS